MSRPEATPKVASNDSSVVRRGGGRFGLTRGQQAPLDGVHALREFAHIVRGVDVAIDTDHRTRRGQTEVHVGRVRAGHGRQARVHHRRQGHEIALLFRVVDGELAQSGELPAHVAHQELVLLALPRLGGQHIVAQRDLGARQRPVQRGQRGAYLLRMRDPFVRACELCVGAIGIAAAGQQQRQGDDESGQDLDLDRGEGRRPLLRARGDRARREQNSAAEKCEAHRRVERHRRQPAIGGEFTRIPQIAEQRDRSGHRGAGRAQLDDTGEARLRHGEERRADGDERRRAERRYPSGERIAGRPAQLAAASGRCRAAVRSNIPRAWRGRAR